MSRHQILQSPELFKALTQMTEALRILDDLGAPGEIGAHLDLAIARLEEQLGLEQRQPTTFESPFAWLAAEPPPTGSEGSEPPSAWDFPPG